MEVKTIFELWSTPSRHVFNSYLTHVWLKLLSKLLSLGSGVQEKLWGQNLKVWGPNCRGDATHFKHPATSKDVWIVSCCYRSLFGRIKKNLTPLLGNIELGTSNATQQMASVCSKYQPLFRETPPHSSWEVLHKPKICGGGPTTIATQSSNHLNCWLNWLIAAMHPIQCWAQSPGRCSRGRHWEIRPRPSSCSWNPHSPQDTRSVGPRRWPGLGSGVAPASKDWNVDLDQLRV